jgi:molybdenum cofactor synthesis domain-containing protein
MSDIVTAGILVIGDEILSGRTKDKNIGFIAEYLTNIGIDLKEVRVVADEEAEIIAALDALRHRYTYVFTTGGIGPTHDDITADSVAKAFGVGIDIIRKWWRGFKERFQNRRRVERGAAADGADSRRRRTDPERDHPRARLQDRQCHRDGRACPRSCRR